MSFFDELPPGRNTDETEERESMIVGAVVSQQHDPFEWWGVEVADKDGNQLTFYIMRDALKIEGVRINVSATGAQQIADVLGALLPTALMTDLTWESAFQLPPSPQQITSSTKAMIAHSERVDALIGGHDDELVADVGKYWILTNKLVQRPPGARLPAGIVSANYGWHFKGENFQGLRGEQAVSLRERVIQGVGLAHDRWHTDYSQVCRLVSAYATLNDQKVFLADVLTDPDTAHLVSNEGVLVTTRQPAVDPIACPLPPSIAGLGQCPLPDEPGWPAGAPAGKMLGTEGGVFGSSMIGILGKSLLIGGVGVGAYALARRFFP